MSRRFQISRTGIAIVLVVVALGVPCAAWYVVGSREAEREAAEHEQASAKLARDTARQLADRVRVRLDALLESEARRPFYHFQNLYHDPKGAAEGAAVVQSPLAEGPTDPLIETYFQVNPKGELSLPTLNLEVQEANQQIDLAQQETLQRELARSIPGQLRAPQGGSDLNSSFKDAIQPQSAQKGARYNEPRVEALDKTSYEQTRQANWLYSDIKKSKSGEQPKQAESRVQQLAKTPGVVNIRTGAFRWETMEIRGRDSLVALREVTTPDGTLRQGFMISAEAVAESFKGGALPARFEPQGDDGGAAESSEYLRPRRDAPRLPVICESVAGTGWQVAIEPTTTMRQARERAREIRGQFTRNFLMGACAAGVAGVCLVGLVGQTERLARQRSQFAASAAHELRTPLAGLRIYSEMLAEGLGDPSRASDYARRIASEAERLGRVVANVLGFTRLERGILKSQPVLGDLGPAVRDCVERQRTAIEVAGAQLDVTIADNLPSVRFDRDAVGQIAQNLLDNAEKHTRAATDRKVHVRLEQRGDTRVALIVSDHGTGVPAEVRRRLFQPFARGNQPDAPAGMGLGLVMVQALARSQGAMVEYAEANGGGAQFTVTFSA